MKTGNMNNFKISIYQAELILGYDYVQRCKIEDGISKNRKKVSPKITARWFKDSKINLYYHTGGPSHFLFSSSLGFCCEYKEASVYDAMHFFGFLALEECHEKGVTSIPQEQWQAYENYLKEKEKIDLVLKQLAKMDNFGKISIVLNYIDVEIKKPLKQSSPEDLLELFKISPLEIYTNKRYLYTDFYDFMENNGFKKISIYEALLEHGIYCIYMLCEDGKVMISEE